MSFLINTGASLTFTSGSVAVTVSGTNAVSEGVLPGDFAIDPSGLALPITAVASGTLTLARPAPGSGTVSFVVMLGPARSLVAQATATTRDVWAQITAWADRGLSIPVIAQQNAPPSTPADGDRYLVGTAGSGAWAAKNNLIATWSATAGAWLFTTPSAGWQVTVNASFVRLQYSGSAWGVLSAVPDATTVAGRLARFTNTSGQLGEAQASEDGSGNVTIVARATADSLRAGSRWEVVQSSTLVIERQIGDAVSKYSDFDNHYWRSGAGAHRMSLTGAGILAVASRVDIGTVGSLGLPLQVAGNAQFGPKAGPGVRYQVVSTTYQLAGINHDNNAYNALALSTTGNNDLLVDTSALVTVRVGLRIAALGAGTLVTDASGNVGISSSEKLKTEIAPWSGGLDAILAMEPISYRWSERSGMDRLNTYHGFSAEQVHSVLPEAVGMNRNGTLSLSDRVIVAALVNAVKTLNARLEALENA